MSARGADRRVPWSAVLVPLLDHVAPPEPVDAVRRVRNFAFLGGLLPWILPQTGSLGTAETADLLRASVAFGVVAVGATCVGLFAGGRSWAGIASAAACAVAALVAGWAPCPWAIVIGALAVAQVLVCAARARLTVRDEPARAPRWHARLAYAVAAALVFREFVALPMVVPTGSMEPTIYGIRRTARTDPFFQNSGDWVLVDRTRYLFRGPQRWDIAVFDYPLHRPTSFVKRVIGLPGETVEIRDGNLWIDGAVARKPQLLQDTLWREIFPRPSPRAEPKKIAAAWTSSDRSTSGAWTVEEDGVRCKAPAARDCVLSSTSPLRQGDLRVRFRIDADSAAGWSAKVRITSRGHVAEAALSAEGGVERVALTVDGTGGGTAQRRMLPHDLELSVADGRAAFFSDGRELASADIAAAGPGRNGIELVVGKGSNVAFRRLGVDQDQAWVRAQDGTTTWKVPEGAYFVLGDNSERSEDSREWAVTELEVEGDAEPVRLVESYPGEDGNPVRNVRRDARDETFHDLAGVPRRIARDAIRRRRGGVAWSFVPRDHFAGRAAFVFFPFAPPEGGFRPRLLP